MFQLHASWQTFQNSFIFRFMRWATTGRGGLKITSFHLLSGTVFRKGWFFCLLEILNQVSVLIGYIEIYKFGSDIYTYRWRILYNNPSHLLSFCHKVISDMTKTYYFELDYMWGIDNELCGWSHIKHCFVPSKVDFTESSYPAIVSIFLKGFLHEFYTR